jgi:formylglycine-generating enzyme required for sulfatase activity
MEFIPGETLKQRLDRVGPLDVPEVLRIGRQIAEGLAAAHATDLIHRDIKPGNVLLEGGQHKVKITDFGLARTADDASISQSGIIAGTPMYMAPEQAQGQTLDQRADLFSLGSVLYQMVAGRPPFRASTTVAVLKRVAEDQPRAIREIIPETPQWLCDIIAKLHAKNPDDRYQSAREVADVLADCEAQLKANARLRDFSRIPQSKPAAGRFGRWKWVAAGVPLLLLIVWGVYAVTQRAPNLDDGVPGTPLVPAAANDLHLVSGGPTDLIPFARPDLSEGRWQVRDGKLVHLLRDKIDELVAIPLAVRGPDEFDLEAEFERTTGEDFIAFGMSAHGHRFGVILDGWRQWAGVSDVARELINVNPTRRMGPWLTNGRRHALRCEVRASGIRAWLDGREVADYRGGYDALSISPARLPDWVRFCVVANSDSEFVVHKLVLSGAKEAKKTQESSAKQLGIPVETTNSIGMKLRLIPPGKFTMGSSKEEIDFWLKQTVHDWGKLLPGEGPRHEVEITHPLYMGQTEVTVGQFRQFLKATGYKTQAERERGAYRWFPNGEWKMDANTNWLNPGFAQTDDHPVVCVSWNDAVEFCNWLSKPEGKHYRMPTEAEWEYSCRTGSEGRWSFGDNQREVVHYARIGSNSQGHTWPVAGLKGNLWGLHDMHGNVSEWCQDVYDANYYETSPPKDPPGPSPGGIHLHRGGSWADTPVQCRSAFRCPGAPGLPTHSLGFRVVLVVSPPASVPTESGAKDKPSPKEIASFTNADVQRIAALPAAEQVAEVRQELMRRNPGFDGKVGHKIEDGVVTEFRIVTDKVADIAPIRVWSAMRVLECRGTYTDNPNGLLADLTPLKGMNLAGLKHLNLINTRVTDAGMASFKDCKDLRYLNLFNTRVTDAGMAFFKDCKALTQLNLAGTKVSDAGLAHFKGMPLLMLWIQNTGITDLTPLQGMPLEDIRLSPKNITRGLGILRDLKSLKTIGIEWNQVWPAAEFWQRYDKGEFKE